MFKKSLTFTRSKELGSGCNLVWDGQEISKNDIKDGTIVYLNFKEKEDIKIGKYPIIINCDKGDVVDENLETVDLSIVNGKIEVK